MWVLSLDAVADLDRIAGEGALQFGFALAERHEQELVAMLDTLADHPYLAAERQASQQIVRLMPCGSHNILYAIDNEDVIILRVLHGLQNWFELL